MSPTISDFGVGAAEYALVVPEFFDGAHELRAHFEERFSSPPTASADRFVWDYFHQPEQFTFLRTLAAHFFPPELMRRFMARLQSWGRDTLGCSGITLPWLSYYVEGCQLELHADLLLGPWTYVYSITDWEHRRFTGGETVLLRPETLDFWRGCDPTKPLGENPLENRIPPCFNQLIVFDERVPHRVRMVQGTLDPLDSRVVLHGWFRAPQIVRSLGLQDDHSARVVEEAHARLEDGLKRFDSITGLLTIRLEFGPADGLAATRVLTNTLVSTAGLPAEPKRVLEAAATIIDGLRFPNGPHDGWAILPVYLPIGTAPVAD
jgi:hypothetical protein